MDRIGRYDILRELGRHRQSATYAARRTGDTADTVGRFAVKVFDTESVDLLSSVAGASAFLDRAKVQQAVVERGARHWVPVREIGTTEEPFVATDLYPLTAERFIARGVTVTAGALYTVVWSVVRGLTELRESFRRAHGNLKPSNILIGGDLSLASPRGTQVLLADPAGEGLSARDRTGDLRAVGELIHLLVLRRAFREESAEAVSPVDPDAPTVEMPLPSAPEWPVPMSPAWKRLGPDGERWLDLCNRLLDPQPKGRAIDLVEVAVALHALTPKRKPLPWKAIAAGVLALALAGGGVAWFRQVHAGARAEYLAVQQQWFGPFAAAMEDRTRQDRYTTDPGLRATVDAMRAARRAGVRFDLSADESLLSYGGYRNAIDALDVARRVERELTPDRWQTLANVEAARRRYESRGWSQPAAYLATLSAGVRPGPDADVAAGVDRLLAGWTRVSAQETLAETGWTQLDGDLAVVKRSGDPVLVRFAEHLQSATAGAIRLTDTGFDGLDAITLRLPLAKDLARIATAGGGWPAGYHRVRIAAELESTLNIDHPTDEDIRRWAVGVEQYALISLDPEGEPLKGLASAYEQLVADVTRQSQLSDEEQARYGAERSAVQEKVKSLATSKFVRRDVARGIGEIPVRADDIRRDLERLRKQWVRLDDPQQWIAFVDRPLPSTSDVLRQRWTAYIAGQRSRLPEFTGKPEVFKQAKLQADTVRELLAETGRQFPLGADGLGETLAAAAFERRESILKNLSKWADPAGGAVTPPTPEALEASVKTAGEAFTAWTNKLLALTKVFPPKAEVLLPTDRPDAAWAKDDPDFWADPVVQQYVKKDLDRLNALSAVAGMSRGDLVAAAEQSPVLEVALAAWRRLGEPPAAGVVRWPDTPAELQKELDIRNRLAVMTNAVQSAGDRDPIARDWRVQGPARWRTFTNAAVVPADGDTKAMLQRLDAAVRFRSALLVDDAEIAKLLPAARFNYVLYVARVTVPDVGEGVTRAASDALRRAIAELGNRAEVRTLAARLEKLNDPEPMSVDARLLAPVPPATLNVPIRDRYELSFVRVESPGLRPFYLSETELSLGQFIELVNASGGWTAANALLGNDSVPGAAGPTPLRGPRLWQRPGAANVPIDRFPETWRYDNAQQAGREFTFEPSYRLTRFNRRSLKPELGGNPTYDHPMQQLPARAALFAAALSNCRLPTSREWQAAYEQQRKAQGDAWSKDWNLRDALWQKQIKFTETDAPGQWPLEDAGVTVPAGVFAPAGLKATDGVAGFRSGEDGVLLFRPVNGGAGTFKNLVGNVAELLCDQPDAWDHLADRKTADGIARFVQANGSQLRVVGGSAFSPPELDPLRPAALTSAAEPFCDVGVRLAFTAPARSTAERLKWFIDEQAYLSAEPQP